MQKLPCSFCLLFFLSFRVVSHSGLQTYMLLYFRSKEDSCSWGHPTYTMRALQYVGLPISGGCEPPHHHGSCVSECPSTVCARRTPFGCKFKGGEVSSPARPDCAGFQIWRQKPAQFRRTVGAQRCTSHIFILPNEK